MDSLAAQGMTVCGGVVSGMVPSLRSGKGKRRKRRERQIRTGSFVSLRFSQDDEVLKPERPATKDWVPAFAGTIVALKPERPA